MQGTLAAGKTTITKGIAKALDIEDDITSPTFTLISEYEGKMPLYHMDVYRLDTSEDFINLGTEDLIYGKGVSIIEWSEKIMDALPKNTIILKLEAQEDNSRIITFVAINEEKKAEISLDIGMHQSEMILPCINQVLSYVDLQPENLEFTALCLGPGTFTGLRLAFAALKAFSITNNVPVYAIPSLEAYAHPYLMWRGAVVPVIDVSVIVADGPLIPIHG